MRSVPFYILFGTFLRFTNLLQTIVPGDLSRIPNLFLNTYERYYKMCFLSDSNLSEIINLVKRIAKKIWVKHFYLMHLSFWVERVGRFEHIYVLFDVRYFT